MAEKILNFVRKKIVIVDPLCFIEYWALATGIPNTVGQEDTENMVSKIQYKIVVLCRFYIFGNSFQLYFGL